ncbi:MAG: hypothetical protein ABIZ72_11530, partial [Candidatus Limnocylindrales bacterium]
MDIRPGRVTPAYPRLRIGAGRSRRRKAVIALLVLALVGGAAGVGAIATNTMGAGRLYERFIAKVDGFLAGPPPPDRSTEPTVVVTPKPATPSPSSPPSLPPTASGEPPATPAPTPTPIPRVAVDVDILQDHEAVFAHELHED